jgi:pantothenate kinase
MGAQDGFHYPKSVLLTMKTTECPFQRRGAPFTFDGVAFVKLIKQLRETPVTEHENPGLSFYAPSFDHAVKDPVENDIYISSAERIIILEGNYLLMKEFPWNQIHELVDET